MSSQAFFANLPIIDAILVIGPFRGLLRERRSERSLYNSNREKLKRLHDQKNGTNVPPARERERPTSGANEEGEILSDPYTAKSLVKGILVSIKYSQVTAHPYGTNQD